MKVLKANNDRLKAALSTRDDDIQAMLDYMVINDDQYDDELIDIVNKYLNLSQFLKDLLYLSTKLSVADIADMYLVSKTLIYDTLKKIKKILCQRQ